MEEAGRRQDIQGLRAIAVTLVVVFHLSAAALPGGYIGVDVFFVISGYLITGHLWREVERSGRIRLSEFWARRLRRLLPAALLVLLVSAGAALTVMPETLRGQNLTEVGFATIYVLNWLLAANSVDYLAADNAPSLVQHYWSLSVEEQFYLLWPLLIIAVLWLAGRGTNISKRRAVLVALGIVFALSFAFSMYETARSAPSAYFATTTRAWEFAAGGIVGLLPLSRFGEVARLIVSWCALAAILGSALLMNEETAFPGWVALIPVAGTAALLWTGDSEHAWSPQMLARFGPVQLLGDVSYAVYLWHWPLILVTVQLLGRPPGWIWGTLIFAITIVLGIATKHLVEDPVRRAPSILMRPSATFGATAASMALVGAVAIMPQLVASTSQQQYSSEVERQLADTAGCFGAYAITNDCSDPYAITDTVRPADIQTLAHWDALADEPACTWNEDVDHSSQGECSVEGDDGAPRVLFVGDSHAAQYLAPMLSLAREKGWAFELRSRSVCTGLGIYAPDVDNAEAKGEGCLAWSEQLHKEVVNSGFDAVIVTARPRLYEGQGGAAAERLRVFSESGARVIVLGGVPGTGDGRDSTGPSAPECIEESGDVYDPCTFTPEPWADFLTVAAAESRSEFIDPRELLCSDDGVCHSVIGGALVYQDNNHLTEEFAKSMQPWLDEQISPLVEVSP